MITWFMSIKFPIKNQNWIKQFLLNCSLHLWYMIFFYQAHKEERFMYPIYPLLCLTTSLTFNNLTLIVACFSPRLQSFMRKLIGLSFSIFFILAKSKVSLFLFFIIIIHPSRLVAFTLFSFIIIIIVIICFVLL